VIKIPTRYQERDTKGGVIIPKDKFKEFEKVISMPQSNAGRAENIWKGVLFLSVASIETILVSPQFNP